MPRIAIVGAGIAGLNAAVTLQDAGLSCSIYEASNRIGGRMHSDAITWADGKVSEWCGEFIDADHETLHQLIKRFGLTTVDLGGQGGTARTTALFSRTWIFRRSGMLPLVKQVQAGCSSIIRAGTEEPLMRPRRPIQQLPNPRTSSVMRETACCNWSVSSQVSALITLAGSP
jgi:Flavin containing amine oxidoreductase